MQNEIKVFVFLCNNIFNNKKLVSDIQETNNFNDRFNTLPDEIKLELKNRCKLYIKYTINLQKEISDIFIGPSEDFNFKKSNQVIEMEVKLVKYGLSGELEINDDVINQQIQKQIQEFKERGKLTEEERSIFKEIFVEYHLKNEKAMKRFFKEAFGSELILN